MANIEIYSHPSCGFCQQAKALLDSRGVAYDEHDVSRNKAALIDMQQRTQGRTLPQIIINDQAIGGYDRLRVLDQQGLLADLVNDGIEL